MLDYRGFDESLGLTEMGVDRLTDSRLNHGFFCLIILAEGRGRRQSQGVKATAVK